MGDIEIIDRPFPGHFICSDRCKFIRTTDVGEVRVSTVGDLRLPDAPDTPTWIGHERTYETMVFWLGDMHYAECDVKDCNQIGARDIMDWSNIDFDGYNSDNEAELGHTKMVIAWLNLQRKAEECGMSAHAYYVWKGHPSERDEADA